MVWLGRCQMPKGTRNRAPTRHKVQHQVQALVVLESAPQVDQEGVGALGADPPQQRLLVQHMAHL